MVTAVLKDTPASDTFKDVEKLILQRCHAFHRMYGGDFEEIVAVANLKYVEAYKAWKPGKGTKFSTFVAMCVNRRLQVLAKTYRKHKRLGGVSIDYQGSEIELESTRERTEVDQLKDSLSDLGRFVVNLIIEQPDEMREMIDSKGGKPNSVTKVVKDYLYSLGWSKDKVLGVWSEITRHMQAV